MAPQGTGVLDVRISSGRGASGIRFKKMRLTAPIAAEKPKRRANCQPFGRSHRQTAASRKLTKLARFTNAASRERNLPRRSGGNRLVSQGSQAQLEMPRDKLNPNNSARINANCVGCVRKTPVSGTKVRPQ